MIAGLVRIADDQVVYPLDDLGHCAGRRVVRLLGRASTCDAASIGRDVPALSVMVKESSRPADLVARIRRLVDSRDTAEAVS